MADLTTTTHAVYIPETWLDETKVALESNLVLKSKIKNVPGVGTGAKKGDVFHVPSVSDLSVYDIVANTDIEGQAPTETDTTLTLDTSKHCSLYIPKHLAQNFSKYDTRSVYTKKIGYALAKNVDAAIWALFKTLTTNTQGVDTSSATDITDAMVRGGFEILDEGDVPMEDRYMCFYPDQRSAILGIADFRQDSYIGAGDNPIRSGKTIPLYGLPVEFSTVCPTGPDTTPYSRNGLLFHTECLMIGMPGDVDLEYNYVPRRQAWLLSGDILYGIDAYRGATHVVQMYKDY